MNHTISTGNVDASAMKMVAGPCSVCRSDDSTPVGDGRDFEYGTSPDLFRMSRCDQCGLVFLNPRPDVSEFERIYPPNYHSLDFNSSGYGLVHRVRSRLETQRLLEYCGGAPDTARILDLGCGDGFHLQLLRANGNPTWLLEGLDIDSRAVRAAQAKGLKIHHGSVEDLRLDENAYDVVYTIMTLEHVARPSRVMEAIFRILKPGGRLVIITDNTGTLDFSLFRRRHWGGYHFPRHWHLFNQNSLAVLAANTGFDVDDICTAVSPVNWVYSVHNLLVDKKAPLWLIRRFTLKSTISLAAFTFVDIVLQKLGRGALLRARFRKPLPEGVKESGADGG